MKETISPAHTPESWKQEVRKFEDGEPTNVYARNSNPELVKREQDFTQHIEGAADTALFNAGMAVIHTAVESENLKEGDVVICGEGVYLHTKNLYDNLEKRGVKLILVDSGDMQQMERAIRDNKPRLIFLESVSNAEDMRVCDMRKLTEITDEVNETYRNEFSEEALLYKYLQNRKYTESVGESFQGHMLENIKEYQEGNNPFIFREMITLLQDATGMSRHDAIREVERIVKFVMRHNREKLSLIVDNTLASPELYNPLQDAGDGRTDMVVVESATKHYQKGQDAITMGIAYSKNADLIRNIKERRTIIGTYLQPAAEREIPDDIIDAMPGIVKRQAENALQLAERLSAEGVDVQHPNLKEHEDAELANTLSPEGLVTLFYVHVPDPEAFVARVAELAGDSVDIGVSFGLNKTRLFYFHGYVRIAAGSEAQDSFQEVAEAFIQAAQELKE